MADKRISQLVDRGTIANNDVVPIVVSGASTTNKATISSIQTFMQGNLDLGVTSVGLSMPSAFVVTNSPVTSSGNISVTGAGTVSQYIRGDGSLADFPSGGGGGGASVNYYLNGSVSQGTIGGIAYQEMNKVPILGAGTDFTIAADGYIASFITDAGDPALLEIPAGNWNFETYLQASSGGGTPTFYIELYKVNSGGTATLIASNSATPELIAFGTTTTPYFSALAVPTTSLTLTDRLALRYYVTHSGRTITLHTENSNLCQIITTFTTGLTALNGLTAQVQNFATGTSGTDFGISSSVSTHTFNLPDASASARGVVTMGAQNFAGNKSFQNTIFANAGVRLDQNGTALPTFVQNISGTGLSTTGANGVGFNNANNFFFSGSDKGCSVFVVNNTSTRNYTLQDASGTLAFTSDLSGYVTLGTTQSITGVKTFDTGSLILAAAGTANSTHLRNSAGDSTSVGGSNVFGFNSGNNIYVSTQSKGGFILAFNNSVSNRQYDLPNASGTIALTTDLSAYLPLAGGTLTGALNGTSASFSGDITISKTNASSLQLNSNSTSSYSAFYHSENGTPKAYWEYINSNHPTAARRNYLEAFNLVGGFSIWTANAKALDISSTGAATFSSSVGVGNASSTVTFNVIGKSKIGDSFNTAVGGTAGQLDVVGGSAANLLRLFDDNAPSAPRFIVERTGNVGIGTASPTFKLDVAGTGRFTNTITSEITGSQNFIANSSGGGGGYIEFQRSATIIGFIGNAGSVTGSNTDDIALRGQAALRFSTGGNNLRMTIDSSGNIGAPTGTNIYNASDYRLKQNVETISNGLDKISALNPVKFNWIDGFVPSEDGKDMLGFVAQEVYEVIPEAVESFGGNSIIVNDIEIENPLRVNEKFIIPVLVKAIQELKTEIDSLKNQIK